MSNGPMALTSTAGTFLTMLPDVAELRNKADPAFVANVRTSEVIATTVALATGLGIAWLDKDPQPFYVAAIVTLAMLALTEFLIHSQPPTAVANTSKGNTP